jgi:tetratricopeptide (TPR) repeat protein
LSPAPAPPYRPPEDPRQLLSVDDEMREFFAARVDRAEAEGRRLRAIVQAIVLPEGLDFAYEAEGTYDAREAFRRRRGNCQGFSFLVVAVAREYGLEVKFQDFETFQHWNRYGRFIAAVRHTNVRMTTATDSYIVDLRPDLGRPTFLDTRYVVSDAHAFAHFYSTAGFFRLVAGDVAGARRLMERGVEVDPDSSPVWANLGNLHIQQGELAEARRCFEKALRLDRRDESALTGLVDVLRRQGGPAELQLAEKYDRRAQAYRDRNPYYAYDLAGQARERGDLAAAEQQLRRAIRIKDDEPFFHEQLVEVLRQQGREDEARRAEARLRKLRARLQEGVSVMP